MDKEVVWQQQLNALQWEGVPGYRLEASQGIEL